MKLQFVGQVLSDRDFAKTAQTNTYYLPHFIPQRKIKTKQETPQIADNQPSL